MTVQPARTPAVPGRWLPWVGSLLLVTTAAVTAVRGGSPVVIAVALTLAVAVPFVDHASRGGVRRVLRSVGQWASRAVTAVTFTLLGLVVVVLPWSFRRRPRRRTVRASAWHRREADDPRPARPWTADPVAPHDRRLSRPRLLLAGLMVTLLSLPVTGPAVARVLREHAPRTPFQLNIDAALPPGFSATDLRDPVRPGVTANRPDPSAVPAAMADSRWFTDEDLYNTAQGWALDPAAAWRPINPYRLLDFRSRYLTVQNGERRTWRPPPCTCRRITVWMYGGSTTYGLNQRDTHTIASQLARVAHEHGLVLDVHNRGANGHLHWMEAERFAWDLTIEEPPDLVLFYDGVNEIWEASRTLWTDRSGDIREFVDPTTRDLWSQSDGSRRRPPAAPPGARRIDRPPVDMELEDIAVTILRRYDRARTLSRTAATARGVPVRYLWQPSRFSRPLVPEEPHGSTDEENRNRLLHDLLLAGLPDDVIDVSDAVRSTRRPLFTDDVHHNEDGARLIAEEIFAALRADLERIRMRPPS